MDEPKKPEQIIPQKPELFQKNTQQKPKQAPARKSVAVQQKPPQQVQKPESQDEKPVFDVPERPTENRPMEQKPEQNAQQQQEMPREGTEKSSWKKWLAISAGVIIVIGLVYYFLKG